MENYFFEIYQNLKRQGPGDKASTHKAFNILNINGNNLNLLDVGCGGGQQTIDLSEIFLGNITAVDNYEMFRNEFNNKFSNHKAFNRINFKLGDMNNLEEEKEFYDIIWSEGAIYIMGFENGLTKWKEFLKPNGYIVVSHIAWLKDDIPKELYDYWIKEYSEFTYIKNNIDTIKQSGYKFIDSFILPNSSWTIEYYTDIVKSIELFEKKYTNNQEALSVSEIMKYEIDIFNKYKDYFGYVFFIMQK